MKLFRKTNTEKYTGGRGAAKGETRSEKRSAGRLRCSAITCELGTVEDISANGVRIHCKKKPEILAGDERELTLRTSHDQTPIRARCMWVRVDDRCQFDMGFALVHSDAALRRKLLSLATNGVAADATTGGLTRGWAPMDWWRKAG